MELLHLRTLAKRYPNAAAALAEMANLEAILSLPKPTVHVVSDVHGEHVKLRQVINNASGSLRPLVERVLGGTLPADQLEELLKLVYYPRETYLAHVAPRDAAARRQVVLRFTEHAIALVRELARRYTIKHVEAIVPDPFDPLFRELVFGRELERDGAFVGRLVDPFVRHDRDLELVRTIARVVRNLAVGELIVAGDLGDRGPRIDKVIEILEHQPNVAITFGNHDASWLAAGLGHPAAIATVVRLALRYQRLAQLEEGYGIPLAPVERLAREAYGDDPAARFAVEGPAGGDALRLARMQKAIAILQFKLEGRLFLAHPEWDLAHRALLHQLDLDAGTLTLDGVTHPLLDAHLPTVDRGDPYALAPAEARCLAELTRAFTASSTLGRQLAFVAAHGHMALRRDRCAIFHGCMPVDADGAFLPFVVDGEPRRGKALFDALDVVIQRAVRRRAPADLDLLFYLWTGPRSPCFGKDKMATFESYLLADPATHVERKNPYFRLIHEPAFCARVLAELGADPQHGFLVNGHVPVRPERGESPIKRSGRAITIDGAFAAAYGDKGFSLVLDADRMYLAQHHHFESPAAAVEHDDDIVPTVSDVERYDRPRTVADTERGPELRAEIAALEELVQAFDRNVVPPTGG